MGITPRFWPARRAAAARILGGALAVLLAVFATPAAMAASKSAVLVLDANTGRDLYASAADEPRHPASLTKMMTIYMAFELIEQGRLSYHTKLKISANAAATAPTKLDLDEGEEIALIDAIKALITKSANDMAVAIAEHIAGSEERFAELMTQKARQLGMTSTVFKNASGLPDPEQITTARDMIKLGLHLQDDYPKHYPLFALRTFTYKDETLHNHNTLLENYEGTDGIKTGYTRASGFNLVVSVRRGKKHVVGAIFGGASAAARNAAMRTFLNMGLVKASTVKTRQPAPLLIAARPRPAGTQASAAVPTPRRVERPAAPALPAQAAPAPSPTELAAAPSPAIEIARVRSVLVSPRPGNAEAGHPALRGTIPPSFEDVLARANQPARSASTTADEPPSSPPRWADAAAGNARMRLAAAPAQGPPLMTGTMPAMGAAPSTLERQAANLERGEVATAPSAPLRERVPVLPASTPMRTAAVPTAPPGDFQIQIGAFQTQVEAEKRLAAAREVAPALLARRAPLTQQVKKGDKVFYRARYAGFDAKAAADACTDLKRLKFDCLATRGE
ncbi:MAG TPA: serine hydrolase [Hyphomicrobiaceae bacterium]|nr:serine hydrolase [Hyphomicrobiaceae bacterium]